MKVWTWIVGGLLALGSIAALLVYMFTKNKALGDLGVSLVEARHAPKIRELTEKIDAMSQDMNENAADIELAKIDVSRRKTELKAAYSVVGMSADDVVARMSKLKV